LLSGRTLHKKYLYIFFIIIIVVINNVIIYMALAIEFPVIASGSKPPFQVIQNVLTCRSIKYVFMYLCISYKLHKMQMSVILMFYFSLGSFLHISRYIYLPYLFGLGYLFIMICSVLDGSIIKPILKSNLFFFIVII